MQQPGRYRNAPDLPSMQPSALSWVARLALHLGAVAAAVVAFAAYEHFKIAGQSNASLVSLLAAAGLGLSPLRALARELWAIEGKALHLVHGVGGLALVGLSVGGVISGGPLLSRAALAPFAIMGAAQALMHSNQPRNAEQSEAMQTFIKSMPEVEQFTSGTNLATPENAVRAVTVLTDLVGKAEALGETELKADPEFQSALARVSTRMGVSLGLDAVESSARKLSDNPAVAKSLPALLEKIAQARKTIAALQ